MGARTCRRSPRRGRPGRAAAARPAGPISAGFLMRISLGRSRWPSQIWSGCSGVPGERRGRAVDLVLERVLPAGADLADADRAAGAVLEAQQDRGGVLGRDLAGRRSRRRRSVEKVSTGPVGSWRASMNVARSAMTATTRWPVTKVIRSSQCDPMSPTARSAPPRSGCEPPVPVALEEQPVLEVAAGDEPDVADRRRRSRPRGRAG